MLRKIKPLLSALRFSLCNYVYAQEIQAKAHEGLESRLNPGFKLFTLTNPLAYYFILSQDKIIKVLIKITYSKYKKCLNTTNPNLKVINGSGLTLIRSFINSSRLSSISVEANLFLLLVITS